MTLSDKYTAGTKVETITKGGKTSTIYRTTKVGTKRVFFYPVTDAGLRITTTLFARQYDAANLAKRWLAL